MIAKLIAKSGRCGADVFEASQFINHPSNATHALMKRSDRRKPNNSGYSFNLLISFLDYFS
ncbi:hypothetical protein [Nostoc parmelioides]|uniref:hypothetical protein n=1 Tax=Anabaena sp. CCY 9910 TaxID=3103870 RepID=UPI001683B0E7